MALIRCGSSPQGIDGLKILDVTNGILQYYANRNYTRVRSAYDFPEDNNIIMVGYTTSTSTVQNTMDTIIDNLSTANYNYCVARNVKKDEYFGKAGTNEGQAYSNINGIYLTGYSNEPTYTDVSASFSIQHANRNYEYIRCDADLTEYDLVFMAYTAGGYSNQLMNTTDLVITNIGNNLASAFGIAKNVENGQYFGMVGTNEGQIIVNKIALGIKF